MEGNDSLLSALHKAGLLDHNIKEARILLNDFEGPVRTLARAGYFQEQEALQKLAVQLNREYLDLDDRAVNMAMEASPETGRLPIDNNMLWEQRLVPLYLRDDRYIIAVTNPFAFSSIRGLEFALGKPLDLVLAEESKIMKLLKRYYPPGKNHFDQIEELDVNDAVEIVGAQDLELQSREREKNYDTPPVLKLCNWILTHAVRQNASDIHIEPLERSFDVRLRVDGVMRSLTEVPQRLQAQVTSRLKLLCGMDISERRRPQDGRLQLRSSNELIDVRASCIPTACGEKIVLRLLRPQSYEFSFEDLGMPLDIEKRMKRALNRQGRMLLVTGPTGSGKTTTLYTCLRHLNDGSSNIETVEDPIEYRLPGISQIQVNEAADMTFASALRSILRQDPDIIMVGEIRDEATITMALQAAQTGHLVLSTLHTNDAPSVITRLEGLHASRDLIASGLYGVMAQRLVRKNCEACTQSDPTHSKEAEAILNRFEIDRGCLKKGTGCNHCHFTGYKGRVGVYSYLEINELIAEAISHGKDIIEITRLAKKNGYQTLPEAAADLLKSGITSYDEVERILLSTDEQDVMSPIVVSLEAEPHLEIAKKTSRKKKKVLVIDDDEDICSLFSSLLERDMYDVTSTTKPSKGLELIIAEEPDLILLDLMMPQMDGKEILSRIRSDESISSIPVIILTAVGSEDNEIDLLRLGARDFICKTASTQVILTRIRRALSQ